MLVLVENRLESGSNRAAIPQNARAPLSSTGGRQTALEEDACEQRSKAGYHRARARQDAN